ncbi:MAG: Tripartite DNA replication factor [Cirrosporium novae-zelandiae]|nr:MAG: Tripartite DNA replication factor [Cirrosporium novae-zelandiae]
MSSRQKSFFEQDHKSKARPYRQSNHYAKHYARDDHSVKENKPAIPAMPVIAASTQTKSKLKVFEFSGNPKQIPKETPPLPAVSEKENRPLSKQSQHKPSVDVSTSINTSENEEKATTRNDCPTTPSGRLPLQDLIGDNDNNITKEMDQIEPEEEKVSWSNSPQDCDMASSLATPAMSGRRKKRARSSSPISSQNDSSSFIRRFQHSVKTPQNNRAADLLKRFAEDSCEKPTYGAGMTPAMEILKSSPSSNSSRSLQRSVSCGNVWPISRAKRRRVQEPGIPDDTQNEDDHDQAKVSRLTFLVEKIEESLTAPLQKEEHMLFSSSSPLPGRGNPAAYYPGSPLQRPTAANALNEPIQILHLEPTINTTEHDQHIDPEKGPSLDDDNDDSDFGGDDFDMDLLEATEMIESAVTANDSIKPNIISGPAPEPAIHASYDTTNTNISRGPESNKKNDLQNAMPQSPSSDKFGDDDDDDFAAGLEDLAAQYDTQPTSDGSVLPTDVETKVQHSSPADRFYCDSKDCVCQEMQVEDLRTISQIESWPHFTESDKEEYIRRDSRKIQRYLIKSVAEGEFETSKGQLRPEKVVLVQDEKQRSSKAILLRDSWFDTLCAKGSYVHLIGNFDCRGQCIVDDIHNLIILHPDHLISTTTVADAFNCVRRAVLQTRIKATSEANKPLVYGQMLHEVFQEAMKAGQWDIKFLHGIIESLIPKHLEKLYEIHVQIPDAVEHLQSKMPALSGWAREFVGLRPKAGAVVQDRGNNVTISINKLLDVEEHIWSPMYGLKGNIDATVQIAMREDGEEKTLAIPFELKSGKNANIAHRAQTALYTLLLSDRYDIEVVYGVLYYMERAETFRVPAIRREITAMIQQRNELACYSRNRTELPPMLKNPQLCGRCYAKSACFTYHRLVEDGNGETSGLKEKFEDEVKHLNSRDKEFFTKWDDLLTKEESAAFRFRRELWTMLGPEREQLGRCYAGLVIEPELSHEDRDWEKINRFRYTFSKQHPASGFSFGESEITVGEPIVISDEKGHFAFANGYVTEIRPKRITVAVDRHLHNVRAKESGFDRLKRQVFAGIPSTSRNRKSSKSTRDGAEPVVYRLDKDEFSNGMATVRNNLARLMEKDLFRAPELRKLIIDGVAPTFKPSPSAYNVLPSASQASLNVDQKNAIEKVMSARDYALVLGMPGTGKTTTIVHILRALVSQGKSVLLTSYTHNAVDNILLKIRNDGFKIFRIGALAKVHPDVQQFADLSGQRKKSFEDLRDSYENSRIVATTCLGVNHPVFNERIFDYCIVDEASQITLPVCLGPIRLAKTFILVGDHNQLPPLVQNKEALEGGLDISLFKLLSDKQPSSVVNLEHQYRMCQEVMLLSNTLIYNGRLKCGTEKVATRSLSIPNISHLKQFHHEDPFTTQPSCLGSANGNSKCWLQDLISPSTKATFINTDSLLPLSRESAFGSRIINPTEVKLCSQLVDAFLATGVPATEIGIITLYRSQLALLKQEQRHHGSGGSEAAVEIHTADRFQGRDKEIILLSLVRSNEQKNVGDLLKDWRRVNVAFTRARTKLLILGSKSTLESDELMRKFLGLMEAKGWIYNLPNGALGMHVFDKLASQATTSLSLSLSLSSSSSPNKKNKKKKQSPTSPSPPQSPSKKIGKPRTALSPLKASGVNKKNSKIPNKAGKTDARGLLRNRPVLRDIVNDAF